MSNFLVVLCPTHGVVATPEYLPRTPANYTFEQNAGYCPVLDCGAIGPLIDTKTKDAARNLAKFLNSLRSQVDVEELQRITADLREGRIDQEEAVEQARRISSAAAKFFRFKGLTPEQRVYLLGIAATALAALLAPSGPELIKVAFGESPSTQQAPIINQITINNHTVQPLVPLPSPRPPRRNSRKSR